MFLWLKGLDLIEIEKNGQGKRSKYKSHFLTFPRDYKSWGNKSILPQNSIDKDGWIWKEFFDNTFLRSIKDSVGNFILKVVKNDMSKEVVSWERYFVEYFLKKYFWADFSSSLNYFKEYRGFKNENFLSPIREEFLLQIGLRMSDIEQKESHKRQLLISSKLRKIDYKKNDTKVWSNDIMSLQEKILFLHIYTLLFAEWNEKTNLEKELDKFLYIYNSRN